MIKKLLMSAVLVVLLLALGVGALLLLFLKGQPGVGNWVANQVVAIVNTYLVPQLSFETFSYSHPGRLTLHNVALTAPEGDRVIEMPEMNVELAEVPRRGQPIVIEGIEIRGAALRLIQEDRENGIGFRGLVPIVHEDRYRRQEEVPADRRLSNVLEMRKVRLIDSSIHYDAGDGQPPMTIGGLSLDLDIDPDEDDAGPGWYTISTSADRRPVFNMSLDGRFNLDTFVADISDLTFTTTLNEQSYAALPPQIQSLLREHDVRGSVRAVARGTVPLTEWRTSRLGVDVRLLDINIAMGEGRLPIAHGDIHVDVTGGMASIAPFELHLLAGVLDAGVEIDLDVPELPAELRWRIVDVRLREALRSRAPEGQAPRLAGILESTGEASFMLTDPIATISGRGELSVAEGRLVLLPLVRELAAALNLLGRLQTAVSLEDNATAEFRLTPDGIDVRSFEMISQVVAARGSGMIGYDGSLDLIVNAGPLERVQSLLGELGDLLGRITDRLVRYRVRGTFAEPRISVQPLRIGS